MVHESEPKRKPSLPLDSTVFNDFHLGECIGKGASGTVFKGLNMKNGEVVAIKQIRLTDLSKIALDAMMLEINLLKKLNHTNIVHYSGYFKTKDYLNIVLEYCENGSLQSICKKIGKIPENLAGVYIAQVLEGLLYLHEQGVVHRDIKGANILTTKDACVKLSDFGVATLATHDRTVVGSPYWMAPEVIELTGATTASDIWSLGCTVIELLEGNPPYHYLSPMPALFRIVQDDHPPLPEGCSAMVKDFLLQCFQKDANLRVTAKKLLKHPWIQNSQRKPTTMAQGKIGPNFDQDLRTVREWNEALKGSLSSQPSPIQFNSTQKNLSYPQFNDLTPPSPPSAPIRNTLEISSNQPTAPLKSRGLSITALQPEEDEDNWDDDFDITTPTFSLTQIKKEPQARKRANSRAVREVEEYGEDYLMDNVSWKERIKDMELRLNINSGSHRLLYPSDLHWFAQQQHQLTNTFNNNSNNDISIKSKLKAKTRNIDTTSPLARYMEEEEEGYEDLFFDSEKPNSPSTMHSEDNDTDLMHKAHLEFRPGRRGNSTDGYPTDDHSSPSEDDEDDPFHSLEEGLEQTDLQANILRDKHARVSAELKELIQLLKPEQDDMVLIRAATKLETILLEHPHLRSKLLAYHGVLPILEMLESSDLEPVLTKLLRTINLIVHSSIEVQENLCLVGGIPIIMGLASKRYPWPVRLEAAYFIKQMCHTSLLTLQMFISCRGLKVLVDFMEEDYRQNKELIFIAINGISSVFELQTPTPKHDFCRLFAKSGLLEPLAMALTATLSDSERAARKYTHRIIQLFFIFSQADAQVKERMGNSIVVIQHLLSELKRLPTENIIIVLKCIKNLSSHPNTLETLERANIIETLTHYLAPRGISGSTEICSQVLNTLYNLCRINKRRQDRAAQAGAIPHLQQVVAINSPLKQVALPILCDMAHAGPLCRKILWKNHGLHFYLGLLRDPTWQVNGLESVLVWLQEEPKEVEKVLIESQHIEWLTRAFGHPRHNLGVEGLCVPLAKMVRLSPALSASLSMHPRFVHRLLHRLVTHSKALVRVNLLKILRSLFDVTPAPTHSILKNSNVKHNIKKVLENLVSSDPAVLVQEMAKELQQYLCNPGSSSSPNTISLN